VPPFCRSRARPPVPRTSAFHGTSRSNPRTTPQRPPRIERPARGNRRRYRRRSRDTWMLWSSPRRKTRKPARPRRSRRVRCDRSSHLIPWSHLSTPVRRAQERLAVTSSRPGHGICCARPVRTVREPRARTAVPPDGPGGIGCAPRRWGHEGYGPPDAGGPSERLVPEAVHSWESRIAADENASGTTRV
jgi:hypothetical protein